MSRGLWALVSIVALIPVANALGQRSRRSQPVVSPEIHADRTVTFRIQAPEARNVLLEASFLPRGRLMLADARGVWSTTAGPLEPEIYEYNFVIDGLKIPDPLNPFVKVWRRRSRSMVLVPGPEPAFYEEQNVPHGTVHVRRYHSKSLDVARAVYVYTPPGYEVQKDARFPVLYLLHGSGDTEDAWTVVGRANLILDNAIARGRARPMIVVMPYGHTPSAGADRPPERRHAPFERDLIEDVVPLVQTNYRVLADRRHRAVAGLSMGGGQSLRLGLGHPDLFGWLAAFSAGVPPEETLEQLLETLEASGHAFELFWVGCGRDDFLFEANQRLLKALEAGGVDHVARITDGAHEWRVWRRYLNEIVPLLFREDR
jgi:enterochelin esterase family protein